MGDSLVNAILAQVLWDPFDPILDFGPDWRANGLVWMRRWAFQIFCLWWTV